MTDVRPFRGLRYDTERAGPLATLLCPPYDSIEPDEWHGLGTQSQFNSVHLELAAPTDGERRRDDPPARAAATLAAWRRHGILGEERRPTLYIYEHRFRHPAMPLQPPLRRRGLLAAVRLHDWDEGVIRPHERTMPGPVAERLRLLRATQINLSPLFALYADPQRSVAAALAGAWSQPPEATAVVHGEEHSLRVVSDPVSHQAVGSAFADRQLVMADGHHRYEGALAYRDEGRASHSHSDQHYSADNFVLVLLVDLADPALCVLPTHRLARGIATACLSALPLPAFPADWVTPIETARTTPKIVAAAAQAAMTDVPAEQRVFALVTANGVWRVTPPSEALRSSPAARKHPRQWQGLDVAVADMLVLEDACQLPATEGTAGDPVLYTRDAVAAVRAVQVGNADLAILLRPVTADQIVALAQAGHRMPQKSTYFYPKPATGLVFRSIACGQPRS